MQYLSEKFLFYLTVIILVESIFRNRNIQLTQFSVLYPNCKNKKLHQFNFYSVLPRSSTSHPTPPKKNEEEKRICDLEVRMGFSWLKKWNIFAISVSWTFQGGPNVNSFFKQMVQWAALMKTWQHSKAEEYF